MACHVEPGNLKIEVPSAFAKEVKLVVAEVERATAKYPPFNSPHEGFAVLKEEVDELWDDVKRNNHDLAKSEAIQVAAMAIRYLMDC